jgi:ubiquitin-protein ligase
MSEAQREQRLADELARLKLLQDDSTVFSFEPSGEPPSKYVITFRGRGISRSLVSSAEVEEVELHRCEIRLPYGFPENPPDIRWLTPIHHPNISFSGLVKLKDVGLPWEDDLTLDIICERLWDMARLAYYDEERATNYAARNWLAEQHDVKLPVDARPLRDKTPPQVSSNIVKYSRRTPGKPPVARAAVTPRVAKEEPLRNDGIVFIGDDAPAPTGPRRRRPGEEDVLYIDQ